MKPRVAVVIGGSSGIGEAIARRLGQDGIRVVVVASGHLEKAIKVAEAINHAGGSAIAKVADVRDAAGVDFLFGEVWREEGALNILVNCAGIFKPTTIGSADLALVDQMLNVNIRGTFLAINAAVPLMKACGGGKIVNISSVAALTGISGYSIYCATKAAISMLTRSLAIDLAPHDININAIAPGNTATPMNEDIRTDPKLASVLETMKASTPSKHVYSQPEDMAELVHYLISPAARAMHGSTLLIDEGLSAGL